MKANYINKSIKLKVNDSYINNWDVEMKIFQHSKVEKKNSTSKGWRKKASTIGILKRKCFNKLKVDDKCIYESWREPSK